MGATYTRQSTYADGDTISADDTNDEFDQLLAAFAASSGHTHDGTTAEGGPVTKLLGNTLTFGAATAGTDITITFDGETNDGVFKWMEDEDYFEFSDDILIASTEKIQFRDTAIYINSSADGQLDLVADTEIQIAATTVDINGNVDVSGTLTVAGAVDFGDAALSNVGAVQLDSISGDADTDTSITFSGSNVITVANAGTNQVTFNDGSISPVTDSDVDLGTTSLRFKDVYVDSITATDQITATGFTGTLDGILGSGSAAAATVTTLDTSGAVNLNLVTDSTSSTSGALIVDGGVGIAKKLYVGTDLDVDGTTNLDVVDIDGAVNIAADTTIASTNKIIFNDASQFIHAPSATVLDLAATDEIELTATLVDVVGNFTNSGTIVSAGKITADAGIDIDNFNIDGTTIALSSGNLDIDVAGNVTIDADGGTVTFADGGASLGTITSSGYSGTAAVATTVTITDNENTNENNAIVFTSGGDLDGGNIGLESDGDLKYNPSTGTLSATNISVSGTFSTVDSVTMSANNAVIFEGATADAHETTLTVVDATADRTITLPNVSGTVPVLAAASNTQVTSTPEELNILDGVTSTAAEINLIDGDTSRGTTAVASGDGILINDAGTMRMTNVDTVSTYFAGHSVGGGNIVTTGALNSGTITSGFGAIDNGSSNITTTGVGSFGSLDISGAIDVDGTTNLDVVDIDGAVNMATTALVTGVLTTTAATVFNGGFASNDGSTITTNDNSYNLQLISTDADANQGPLLSLHRQSGSPADNDTIGSIQYRFNNDADQAITGHLAIAQIVDASDGTEDCHIIEQLMVAGTMEETVRYTPTETVFNEDSKDRDFRVESNNLTSALFVNGADGVVTAGAAFTATGKITADAGIDIDNFNIDGTTIALSSGDMTLDSAGELVLDYSTAIIIKAGGTSIGKLHNASTNFVIESTTSDNDILFKGNDGGSTITALTLDMSAAGAATFNNDVTAFSDERLKSNITTIPDALSKVSEMRGVHYVRNETGKDSTGVIAQELQKIAPELVLTAEDEMGTLSVNYGNITGYLIEAIKELSARVKELESK